MDALATMDRGPVSVDLDAVQIVLDSREIVNATIVVVKSLVLARIQDRKAAKIVLC